jgi:hypothetical protein
MTTATAPTDEGITFVTYYQDSDGDTFGNPAMSQSTCDGPPVGYVSNNTDCDDTNNALNPNTVWYLDADGDGYYTGSGLTQCTSPGAGYRYTGLTAGGDCNDGNTAVNPGAPESCNGVDDNCDGNIDEGITFVTYYQDSDGDSFGNPAMSQSTCDGDASWLCGPTTPIATTLQQRPESQRRTVWYLDADGDGYYTGSSMTQCASRPAERGIATRASWAAVIATMPMQPSTPARTESCNGVDDNCNNGTR